MKKSSFWEKVEKCNHENLYSDYYELVYCDNEYCSGSESHCADCGVFITTCQCGYCNGISGWPEKRWSKHHKKVYEKAEEQYRDINGRAIRWMATEPVLKTGEH